MSRTGITLQEVAEAAATIQQAGDTPTIDKVRAHLGGTGSNTTISKYLNLWRQQGSPLVIDKESKQPPPDLVQAAVENVWQQMREKADADIEAIKTETNCLVEAADQRVLEAQTALDQAKNELDQLQQLHLRQSAEKELLTLDLKSLGEEHTLLQERHKALEARYEDMQIQTSRHLEDLQRTQQKEILLLEEQTKQNTAHHERLLEEIKTQAKDARQQALATIDSLKEEDLQNKGVISQLEKRIEELDIAAVKLEANISAISSQRDFALEQIKVQQEQWGTLEAVTQGINQMLSKIHEQQSGFEAIINANRENVTDFISTKLVEFEENVKLTVQTSLETQHQKLSAVK